MKCQAATGGVGVAAGGSSDKSCAQLIEEVDRELMVFASTPKIDDVKVDSLTSLISRLQALRNRLGKKVGKTKTQAALDDVDHVSKRKTQLGAIVDLMKSLAVFDKKRQRKHASAVQDKVHSVKASGIAFAQVPLCVRAAAIYAAVNVLASDQKWAECIAMRSKSGIWHGLGLNTIDDHDGSDEGHIQKIAASGFFAEFFRQMADPQKADLAAVRLKTLAMIRDFDGVLAPLRVLLYAIEVALDSAKHGSDAVRQAICVYVCVCVQVT